MENLAFILLILFSLLRFIYANDTSNSGCRESEWKALMEFKGSLIDSENRLSSWTGHDCCSWYGVTCNNLTGFVQKLDFNGCSLGGHINASLLNLEQLQHLDLRWNDFSGLMIPAFLGSLTNLQNLSLYDAGFGGEIPQQLGNLSNLEHLYLGDQPHSSLSSKSLNWITGLASLKSLRIYGANLSECVDWLDSVNGLSFLSSLTLEDCGLVSLVGSDVSYLNLTNLVSLHLDGNRFDSTLPPWLFDLIRLDELSLSSSGFRGPIPNMFENLTSLGSLDLHNNSLGSAFPISLCILTSLTDMDLSNTNLQGSLPLCLSKLTSLTHLYLAENKLSGEIPSELGFLTQLTSLDLSQNNFSMYIPLTLGNLRRLQELDVSDNSLVGELSESFFEGLERLEKLSITRNKFLVLNVSSQWIPPFEIVQIGMDSVFVGTQFPPWLQTQRDLMLLVMSNASISGPLPTSGAFYNASLVVLHLSGNQITGNIPDEFCNLKSLMILSLADNQLTGRIPSCLGSLLQLGILDLANNRFSGQIPYELGFLDKLERLHFNGNKLSEELPASMQNLTNLMTLDLGENEFDGVIPEWIGRKFLWLQYLRLESNNFSSEISLNLCQLPSLQILNLAHNNLSGTIPPCLGNLTMMLSYESANGTVFASYTDTLLNSFKGQELGYTSNLKYAKFMSLSDNHLQGEIPDELMNLVGVQSLNLSDNDFIGKIPENIGNLKHLESLDLSMNKFSGTIPQSLANIDSLGYLNLSFNNLVGKIPSGNHFDTLDDPSIYEGNSGLCGNLLLKSCPDDDESVPSAQNEPVSDNHVFELLWIYAGIGPGFAAGFLGVIFTLCFNNSWRYAFFGFLDNVFHRI